MEEAFLDDAALTRFMRTFYGYGAPSASCWFVGIEEGGGSSLDEIRSRIRAWQALGGGELLPLPSPSSRIWHYSRWSHLPVLESRETYTGAVAEWRAEHLGSRIRECKPASVVFFGVSPTFQAYWRRIAGVEFERSACGRFSLGDGRRTRFAIAKHPATRGIGNRYFRDLGRALAG